MSLDYNLTKTSLPRDADGQIQWTTATEYLIFATMSTGIGDLSEKNAPEFFARLQIIQDMDRVIPAGRVTAADIKQHIGMTTNVFPKLTRAQWLKRIVGNQMDNTARSFDLDASQTVARPIRHADRAGQPTA